MGAECGVECEPCEKEESTAQMHLPPTDAMMSAEEKAAEERRLVVQASPPVELHFTSPCEFTLHAHEANTVLEVLEIRAEQIGLPKTAAALLKMEFAEAIMEDPHKTLEEVLDESGLRGQAKVSVHGEDEAGAKVDKANKIDIHEALRLGCCSTDADNFHDLRLVLTIHPERVNLRDGVSICCTAFLY